MKLVVTRDGELLNYLYEHLDMPKKRVKQYLTHGAVYVNQNLIQQYNYPLTVGMQITIDTESKNKKMLPFDIVYEDDFMIVVNKPSGLLCIATNREKERTLYHIVKEYLCQRDRFAKIFIVHRLDKDTSGIVVFAKNEKIKNQLQENWNQYASLREYVAVLHGTLRQKDGSVIQNLKENKAHLVYVTKKNDGKEAITNYQVIKENGIYSMVRILLKTGRKNQIRVAFQTLRHPIVGDKKYGDEKDGFSRLYLHANRLKLYHPVIKKEILFETATPFEFKKIMR